MVTHMEHQLLLTRLWHITPILQLKGKAIIFTYLLIYYLLLILSLRDEIFYGLRIHSQLFFIN